MRSMSLGDDRVDERLGEVDEGGRKRISIEAWKASISSRRWGETGGTVRYCSARKDTIRYISVLLPTRSSLLLKAMEIRNV